MERSSRLLNLIRDNLAAPRELRVVDQGEDEKVLYIYDPIDAFWGVSAQAIVKALNAITVPRIHLRINSPGGDVFEARAIVTAIKEHKSTIVAHIDGIAASAASWIAIAAKEVEMADGAFLMIHQSWGLAMGNSEDMLAMAGLLEKVDLTIVDEYRKRTGKTKQEIEDWMAAETWFTAAEAKAAGFVDSIAATGANASNTWNLTAYAKAPKALTERPASPAALSYDREALERKLGLFEKIAA